MTSSKNSQSLENKWDDSRAAKMSEPEKLLYRSNLLGTDKRITNYGGGNTSAKVMQDEDEVELDEDGNPIPVVDGEGGETESGTPLDNDDTETETQE